MKISVSKTLVAALTAATISACGNDNSAQVANTEAVTTELQTAVEQEISAESAETTWSNAEELIVRDAPSDVANEAAKELSATAIPYPVYPNGLQYRVGNENGLNVVLFQTEDSFEEVDAFYQGELSMPRLSAMSDHVRYSAQEGDQNPWETAKPGIVIHQFNSESEREAVGADQAATTNIIMSFE